MVVSSKVERKQKIIAYLKEHGRSSVTDLTIPLRVAKSTVRDSLREMEAEGLVSIEKVRVAPATYEQHNMYYITLLEKK